jgi:DNA polymerase-3 subunit alpha
MIHLHLHSTFSFLDGYGTPEQYIERCKAIGAPGFCVTDHGNIYGHRQFSDACHKAGLKFVPGCEMYVKNNKATPEGKKAKYFHITILAANHNGYRNLCQLVSLANLPENFNMRPQVSLSDIKARLDGLVVLSGCFGDGILHRAYQENPESTLGVAKALKRMFGEHLWLEVQHHNPLELTFFRTLGEMAGIRRVATVDAHYPRREDYPAEDMMLCIGQKAIMSNPARMRLYDNLWMMSTEEALAAGFVQEELDNAREIFDQCEDLQLPRLQPITVESARTELIGRVAKTSSRLGSAIKNEEYRSRYTYELSVIDKLGLHAYFVIMGDVINEFKSRGVCVGPARGSAAGSLIAYLIGITEVDPIKHGLSFERFLDLNRRDYPDIDTDFPSEKRAEVIQFLSEKYGGDRVGRLCSFTTYRGGSVFWDVARAYGIDRSVAKMIGKDIPNLVSDEIEMADIIKIPSIAECIRKFPQFKMAVALEGQVRQLGMHASGYAISPVPLTDIAAFNLASKESVLSLDKNTAEKAGLLKLDILSLTSLDMVQAIIDEVGLKNTDLYRLECNDPTVFDLFNQGKVAGIFQFEGASVRMALATLKIESLGDLSFINAVARPGASNALTGNVRVPEVFRQFIYKGKYFVYQEELMAILRHLSFSWEDVTIFRKMVSKKKVTELRDLFFTKYMDGCSRLMSVAEATNFWEVINTCGFYMFNKSHAAAYATLAYWMAYLKVNFSKSFVKHYLNQAEDEQRRSIIRECLQDGWSYEVYRPGSSAPNFTVTDSTTPIVVGGLLSIKGIGPAKAAAVGVGKIDKAVQKAIAGAAVNPAVYAPWAALDNFKNRFKIGSFPEGEFCIVARIWKIKDGHCLIEDINGAERAYFNPQFTHLEEGKVYRLAITHFKYSKIDSAREVLFT